jgi:hypothetical protein
VPFLNDISVGFYLNERVHFVGENTIKVSSKNIAYLFNN